MAVPPPSLKPINSFMKLAKEYDKKDPIVSYFCRMYAVQKGISLDSKSAESKSFLFGLMDQLEQDKKVLIESGNEAITNDIVAEAHIETQSIDMFNSADADDRNGVFNKKVTKAFYTASLLFEVLTQFGETNEECQVMQRYSKWKATYLHKCSQTGETPVPGPAGSGFEDALAALVIDMSAFNVPESSTTGDDDAVSDIPPLVQHNESPKDLSINQSPQNIDNSIPPNTYSPPPPQQFTPTPPTQHFVPAPAPAPVQVPPQLDAGKLDVAQVQKLLKFAVSALEYEDVNSAASNLSDALKLLTSN